MKHTVSVAVHIVTYNNALCIKRCILCLRKQTYKNISILVVDNASSDQTVHLCEQLAIKVIRNTDNIGYAAAHNQAINETKSTYILTLNADVFLKRDFVKHMVAALEKEPSVGSAAGLLLRIDDMYGKPVGVDGTGLFMRKNRRQGLLHEGEKIRVFERQYILGPDGAAAFYRRKMLESIAIYGEIFDEDFFMHKEDVDIVWRAQRAGWKSVFVPEAVAHHIRTFRAGQRKEISATLRRMSLRNRYLLLIKNDDSRRYLKDLLYIIPYDLSIFLYVLFLERNSLFAYREVLLLWKKMKAKRLYIQHKWPHSVQPYTYFK